MAKQVAWTSTRVEEFIRLAALSDDEAYIMRSRVKGATVTEQSLHINKSVPTVHRMIATLKLKYDQVQKEYPEKFPPRRFSAKEVYMDTH